MRDDKREEARSNAPASTAPEKTAPSDPDYDIDYNEPFT